MRTTIARLLTRSAQIALLTFMLFAASENIQAQTSGVPKLVVAVVDANTSFSDIYVAQAKGFFKEAGVDVEAKIAGGNTLNLMVAGQADLAMFGTGQALLPVLKGKSTSIVYGFLGGGNAGSVIVPANKNITKLGELAGKRVATIGFAGASYGFAQQYSKRVQEQGGKAFDIAPMGSVDIIRNSLLSDQIDAVVGLPAWFAKSLKEGTVKLLVDATQPENIKEYVGGDYVESAIFGLTENLQAKRDAVVRFVSALRKADAYLRSASLEDIANTLKSTPEFAPQNVEDIQLGVKYTKQFYAPTLGEISEELWKSSLGHFALWNLPDLKVEAPEMAYGQRVDMSYLQAAKR